MLPDEIKNLIARGETESVEFKISIPPPNKIARLISSLANTQGGIVLFGIREPQQIVGVNEARLRNAVNNAKQAISGEADISLEFVQVNGQLVGVLSVQRSEGIVAASGAYYQRIGDKTAPITAANILSHFGSTPLRDTTLFQLTNAVADQSETIQNLRDDMRSANSPLKKLGWVMIGALIGRLLEPVLEQLIILFKNLADQM